MQVARVIGVLEPGGAQLSALRLTVALREHGMGSALLLAGDATPEGIALAEYHGVAVDAFRIADAVTPGASLQWTPSEPFARWLTPRLADADLVHAHMLGAWWAAARSAPSQVPVVASEHNEVTWPDEDHTGAAASAAPRLDALFVHGPAAAVFGAAIGLPARRIHIGRSAVGVLAARPMPGLASPRITFTGRFREDKGPDVLIEAVAAMADPLPTYLVGDGPLRGRLLSLARRCGVADLIHMPGWSFASERWIAGSSVHVVPSRQEAWSQSAVTGLGLGVPVIGTRVDGLQHTLGCERGLLVQPDDPAALARAVEAVLAGNHPDPTPGRRYAAQFSTASVAARYAESYRLLMREHAPA